MTSWFKAVRVAAVLAFVTTTYAQPAAILSFEVASIRHSEPATRFRRRVLPTRVDFENYSLRDLLLVAFAREVYELAAPDWLLDAHFDIHATYPPGVGAARMPEMLQALLAGRFNLVVHPEPRKVEAYELAVSPKGVRMQEVVPVNDLENAFLGPAGERPLGDVTMETPNGPVRTMLIPRGGMRTVTSRSLYETRTTTHRTTIVNAVRIAMPEFASLLRVNLGRPVIDQTGLTGLYRFQIELDATEGIARGGPRTADSYVPNDVSNAKAIESLGLRLEERREPINVLVVDKIDRMPRDN